MLKKEGFEIEFKQEYTENIKKEVVAFANTNGGVIYIGINDSGEIIGVKSVAKDELKIISMVRDSIKPDVTMIVDVVIEQMENKDIIKIIVNKGMNKPYYINKNGLKPSGVYVRIGSASCQATNEHIRSLIKLSDKDDFESNPSFDQDITLNYLKAEFKNRNILFNSAKMQTMGLLTQNKLYTNLALLLSNKCKHTIKIGVFEGIDKTTFIDKREFDGSLLEQLKDVSNYIDIYNKTRGELKGLVRLDTKNYPEIAIREILINAIVHRDYSFSGSIIINIFYDRIEFISLGGLVPNISLDDIKSGISQPRNLKLASIFSKLNLIEAYGSGISKTLSSYEPFKCEPNFKTTTNSFCATLPNINILSNKPVFSVSRDKREDAIIDHIKLNGFVTRKEVEIILGIGQTASNRILKTMESSGSINSIGKSVNVKYILS